MSEYEIGSPRNPEKSNYIRRNRLQAGLSEATIIAQSSIDGGTMTTAKHKIDNESYLAFIKIWPLKFCIFIHFPKI